MLQSSPLSSLLTACTMYGVFVEAESNRPFLCALPARKQVPTLRLMTDVYSRAHDIADVRYAYTSRCTEEVFPLGIV